MELKLLEVHWLVPVHEIHGIIKNQIFHASLPTLTLP